MRRTIIVGAIAAAACWTVASRAHAQVPQSFTQKIIVPAYFQPGDTNDGHSGAAWSDLASSGSVGAIIFNPYNGPADDSYVSVYRSAINAARTAGKKVIGYVSTSYTGRSIEDVIADIDSYYDWYVDGNDDPIIDGIFVDEVQMHWPNLDHSAWEADQAYYAAVRAAVQARQSTAFVVLNPGTEQHASIADVGDVVINFESSASSFATWSPPDWQAELAPSRAGALIYGVGSSGYADAVNRAKSLNVGWIYVTNDTLSNPWDTLPPATPWSTELSTVSSTGAQVLATALSAASAANASGFISVSMSHSFVVNDLDYKYRRIYIDTDSDATTGKAVGTIGADYLVENYWYYQWTGSGWSQLGDLGPTTDTTSTSAWSINRRDLGGVTGAIKVKLELEEGSVSPAQRRDSTVFSLAADSLPPLPYGATNTSTTITYSLTRAGTFTYRHVMIDTDRNSGTGYSYGGIGAEYLIENGYLYHHAGGGWNWTWLGSASQSCTGDTCTWTISRSSVGETQTSGEASDLVFHASGSSPEYTSSVYTHNFN